MCWMAARATSRQQGVDFQFQWHFDSHSWACPNSFNPLCRQNNARSLASSTFAAAASLEVTIVMWTPGQTALTYPLSPLCAVCLCVYSGRAEWRARPPVRPSARAKTHPLRAARTFDNIIINVQASFCANRFVTFDRSLLHCSCVCGLIDSKQIRYTRSLARIYTYIQNMASAFIRSAAPLISPAAKAQWARFC